jgi:broad specificity phosphatase PhoE
VRLSIVLVLFAFPCIASAQPSTVILVRHAERAAEPPRDPILSERGAARAQVLAETLRDAGVTTIITTQLARTHLTAKPIADAIAVQPVVVAAGGPLAAHVDSVAAAVMRRQPGEVVLVVGHSNTIPAIVAALGGARSPDYCENQYSTLVIMHLSPEKGPRTIRASYGAADPPAAADCSRTMR